MKHVVWDWNGTLLADQQVVLGALNQMLLAGGHRPVDMDTYRRLYTRPVRRFYERLFERPIADHEWSRIDDDFHAAYHAALEQATLAHDAVPALERVAAAGRTQSLLSMARHDDLVPLVARFGVADHFVLVDGLRGPGGGLKAGELVAHLEALMHVAGSHPADVLVIGDAADDAAAAAFVGARCVLYDGGSHPREELDALGLPVATSLLEALDLAEVG